MRTKQEILGRAARYYLPNVIVFTGITGILFEILLLFAAFVRFLAKDPITKILDGFLYFQKALLFFLIFLFLGMLVLYLVLAMEDRKMLRRLIEEEGYDPVECCRWILKDTQDLSQCRIYFPKEIVEQVKDT